MSIVLYISQNSFMVGLKTDSKWCVEHSNVLGSVQLPKILWAAEQNLVTV